MLRTGPWLLGLAVAVGVGSTVAASGPDQDRAAVPRDYYSANGLLNRGLYDLAETEYRRFLSEHEDHDKAATARYGLSVCLYRLGRHEDATVELERLIALPEPPFAAEVLTMLGQCRLATGRHAAAVEAFEQVIRDHLKHDLVDDAVAGAAEALYLSGRFDEAISKCRLLTSRWPDSPLRERTEFFRGLAAMGNGDFAAGAECFEGLISEFPDGPFMDQASLLLAQCHHHNNAVENALRQYRQVLSRSGTRFFAEALYGLGVLALQQDRAKEAGVLFDELLNRHADSVHASSARFYRGRAWYEQGEFDKALSSLEKCAEGVKDATLADDVAYWMAKCRLRQGAFPDAAERLTAAIAAHPQSDLLPEMYYDRAIALVQAGEPEAGVEALEEYRRRYADHSMDPDALHLLGATRHEQGRYDDSAAYCRAFIEQYPKHELVAEVVFLAAENDMLAGRFTEAARGFDEFLKRYPGDAQVVKAEYRLGMALYNLQRFDEAEARLRKVVQNTGADEAFRPGLLALGDIHFQRSEWEQAERLLSDYLSGETVGGSADDALLKLGLALQRQEKHSEAIAVFSRLIDGSPDGPHRLQAVFERGQALAALKRFDEARKAFEQVLAEGGESRFKPYALNHLGSVAMRDGDFTAAAGFFEKVNESAGTPVDEGESLFNRGQALLAGGSFKEAESVLGELLERFPKHARAGSATAQLAIARSRQDRCPAALESIARIEGESGAKLSNTLRRAVQYEKAWCLRKVGRSDEAADTYRALLEGKGSDDERRHALLDLAGIEFEAVRYEVAAGLLRQLDEAITGASFTEPADMREQRTYQLAVCEFELKRYSEAAKLFEEFVGLFPASRLLASASFFCGEAYSALGDFNAAVPHLSRVVEGFPSDPVYPASILRLGEGLAALQRWPRCEQVFSEYLSRFGDAERWFQAQFGVGWARENQGRYDEAIQAYEAVVARHQGPTAARAQFQIGECLFAKKQYDEAVRALLKVDILYAYPEWSAAALYEAGRCFEQLSKPAEARVQFKTVAEKHSETRWAAMAVSKLKEVPPVSLPGH